MNLLIDVTGLGAPIEIGGLVERVRVEAVRAWEAVGRVGQLADWGVEGDREIMGRWQGDVNRWRAEVDVALDEFWEMVEAAEAGGVAVTVDSAGVWGVANCGTDIWWLGCRADTFRRQAEEAGGLVAGERLAVAEVAELDRLAAERWAGWRWGRSAVEVAVIDAPTPIRNGGGVGLVAAGGGGMGVVAAGGGGGVEVAEVVEWWIPKKHGPRCLCCGPLSLTGAVPRPTRLSRGLLFEVTRLTLRGGWVQKTKMRRLRARHSNSWLNNKKNNDSGMIRDAIRTILIVKSTNTLF